MSAKKAFTLIEVMVSVMIISVVIMALLEMKSNSSHIFSLLKKQIDTTQYISLLIANKDYGYEDKSIRLDALIKEFDVDDNLRRKLKNMKAKVIYNEIETIDLSEDANGSSSMLLEIGESLVKTDKFSTKIYRIRLQ